MTVSELMEILSECNQEAVVKVIGDGCDTGDGTWLEGDPVDITYVYPKNTQRRNNAQRILLDR